MLITADFGQALLCREMKLARPQDRMVFDKPCEFKARRMDDAASTKPSDKSTTFCKHHGGSMVIYCCFRYDPAAVRRPLWKHIHSLTSHT